ncbi:hypothetical protein F5B20DRAFT_585216 [Whalleya microplaca]|nr:hypothetical protein F5B20DRAFT_585216 [Whalleya microplaca]
MATASSIKHIEWSMQQVETLLHMQHEGHTARNDEKYTNYNINMWKIGLVLLLVSVLFLVVYYAK